MKQEFHCSFESISIKQNINEPRIVKVGAARMTQNAHRKHSVCLDSNPLPADSVYLLGGIAKTFGPMIRSFRK